MISISSLEKMETIVSKNNNLSWDGWDVVEMVRSDKAFTSKFGALKDNAWYLKKIFVVSRDGWEIPDKYVR
jgi:hypothetical protein